MFNICLQLFYLRNKWTESKCSVLKLYGFIHFSSLSVLYYLLEIQRDPFVFPAYTLRVFKIIFLRLVALKTSVEVLIFKEIDKKQGKHGH